MQAPVSPRRSRWTSGTMRGSTDQGEAVIVMSVKQLQSIAPKLLWPLWNVVNDLNRRPD